ncbi:F1F0-ATPase inhibitor protein [Quillaja saponaria]|uniref:F1F0-ATPase inhibitor protein n=1 Tax=Quillaja saponaria TaxID=32244 RepID=A0AAD7M5X8_QUISA|nr:F1F0-ATPase inhibitor protein [Quillaja saponaria]
MAMRSVLRRVSLTRSMDSTRGATRYFSDGKGRILSEEERAAETVYIQKMERERLEKQKKQAEKEKAEKDKENSVKKTEGPH